jgi:hypothetical protein
MLLAREEEPSLPTLKHATVRFTNERHARKVKRRRP